MASTTPVAFDEFKAKLLLTQAQQKTVNARLENTTKYLRDAFGSGSDLPLGSTRLIGSAARQTIIRPLDDVDVLAVFTNKADVFEKYRADSQAFLYRVRDALNSYVVKVVGARGQAVRLFYTAAPHVDVAAVFRWSGGGFALPNGKSGWLTTDPDHHASYVDGRDQELGHRLKPLVRMLKRWNSEHSRHLKSFHLEMLVVASVTTMTGDSRSACEVFFKNAPGLLRVQDPAGHGGDLSTYLSPANRRNVISNLESARDRAVRANAAERRGDHKEAIRLWRITFGDEFPAFG